MVVVASAVVISHYYLLATSLVSKQAMTICPLSYPCSDTVGRCGMFCAIVTAIERCKTEGVVDVFQVVKALRVQKPGAVTTVVSFAHSLIMRHSKKPLPFTSSAYVCN